MSGKDDHDEALRRSDSRQLQRERLCSVGLDFLEHL
jgi:hypothetical protein